MSKWKRQEVESTANPSCRSARAIRHAIELLKVCDVTRTGLERASAQPDAEADRFMLQALLRGMEAHVRQRTLRPPGHHRNEIHVLASSSAPSVLSTTLSALSLIQICLHQWSE